MYTQIPKRRFVILQLLVVSTGFILLYCAKVTGGIYAIIIIVARYFSARFIRIGDVYVIAHVPAVRFS